MLESERHGGPAWSGVSLDSQGCPLLRDAGEMQKSCCEASNEDEPSISLLGDTSGAWSCSPVHCQGWGVSKQELLVLVGMLSSAPGGCLYHGHKVCRCPALEQRMALV